MAEGPTPPSKLCLSGDSDREWKCFKQKFELYLLATEKSKKSEDVKIALLLTCGGDELLTVYNSLNLTSTSSQDPTLKSVLDKFDTYFSPRKTELAARYKFRKCMQRPGEPLESYITRLRILIKDCNYEGQNDKELRDQIVFGCSDDTLRQKFFDEEDLTLKKTVDICVAYQATKRQMNVFKEETIDVIQKMSEKHAVTHNTRSKKVGGQEDRTTNWRECRYCGQKHVWRKELCPAYGKLCNKCNRRGHFAVKCLDVTRERKDKERVNALEDSCEGDQVYAECNKDVDYLMSVSAEKREEKIIKTNVKIGNSIVRFQVDCGASVNVIPQRYVPSADLTPCDTTLQVWCENTVTPIGKCDLEIENCRNKKKYVVDFVVVKEEYMPLLGKKTSEEMQLITVNYENISVVQDVIHDFEDVFGDGLGCLPGTVHLTIDKDVKPLAIQSCRVPVSLKHRLEGKLKELEENGIISKVNEPSEWVNRLVVATKKSGELRLCIDPRTLNTALKRELHPLPILEEVLPELSKAKVFSCLDLKDGYWHCKLDEESSMLTTFQTPIGRYRWLRLPFGLAVSSEIFQKRLHMALEGIDGIVCVADDILIYGVGNNHELAVQDHDKKLLKLLEKCREKGIKLNRKKVELRKTEISFLGHKVTGEGLKADPQKVEAIRMMKAPTNVVEVQRLSGMVNYLGKFLPHLSEVMEPIRRLTCKGVEWEWSLEQEEAFKKVKDLIMSAPVLQYFDPNLDLVIQCDASQKGLGAALLQNGKPIAYASRALTDVETRYAQIEKEALAIVFALSKFHQYAFGRKVLVQSDHKPLESITLKPLCQAPKRLQGMLMNILQYDVTVTHVKGSAMYLADTLSRAFLPTVDGAQVSEFEHINAIKHLPIREERLIKIRMETENDEVLRHLKSVILDGWPDDMSQVLPLIKPYFHCRDELTVHDGLIFKGHRVVIPYSLRKFTKEAIHSSHLGMDGCLRRARECVFWPGMSAEVKQYVSMCDTCNKFPAAQKKETLMPHDMSDRPWDKVGVDLMTIKGYDYLITVDYFSNFWEIDHLPNLKASAVIRKLKAHFARYGLPSILISDNGPQFVCDEFKKFAQEYDFEHRTSSPHYPQSNGKAESAVKMAKCLIRKAVESGKDPWLAVLDYRNTPTQDTMSSPAQCNLGRRTRTLLPTVSNLLKPQQIDTELVLKEREKRNNRSKWYYDRGAKDLDYLQEDDTVRMKPVVLGKKQWDSGKIMERLDERSYLVECDAGVLRRNRRHLRKTTEDCGEHTTTGDSEKPVLFDINKSHDLSIDSDPTKSVTGRKIRESPHSDNGGEGKNTLLMSPERKVRATRNTLPERFRDFIITK